MALDAIGLRMVAPHIAGAAVLCLGYPDITAKPGEVEQLLRVKPIEFTEHGKDHKVSWRLPETLHTLMLAGAEVVDCVDVIQARGCERYVDLNARQVWPRQYRLVINPGTLEHCFDVATAFFNAWRALEVGGRILHVAPVTMVNHGFWNVCPTVIVDFAAANGGHVEELRARDREWRDVDIKLVKRCQVPSETVLYAVVRKVSEDPEQLPVQNRFT